MAETVSPVKTAAGKAPPARAAAGKAKPAKAAAKQIYDAPLFAAGQDAAEQSVAAADKAQLLLGALRANLNAVIFGQEEVVEQVLIALLAGGHALLVGVPGLAKTKLAESLGQILGLDEKRIQFTPDLMPADIIGSEVMEEDAKGKRSFRYIKGPVFARLLMADEINRAGPRTQAALLQAMQEYHVTIAGKRYDLPRPFHVLATQNPLEQEGTYPLPEAQLDRFLLQISISYPDRETERRIILATTGQAEPRPKPALNPARLLEMQALIRHMPMPENVLDAILSLVRACRPPEAGAAQTAMQKFIAWGPGPRAAQALALCVRARALLQNRLAPSVDDVQALACPALQHRMALNFAAKAEGVSLPALIAQTAQDSCGR